MLFDEPAPAYAAPDEGCGSGYVLVGSVDGARGFCVREPYREVYEDALVAVAKGCESIRREAELYATGIKSEADELVDPAVLREARTERDYLREYVHYLRSADRQPDEAPAAEPAKGEGVQAFRLGVMAMKRALDRGMDLRPALSLLNDKGEAAIALGYQRLDELFEASDG